MSIFTSKTSKKHLFSYILSLFTSILIIFTQVACSKSGNSDSTGTGCNLTAQYTPNHNSTQNSAMVAYCVANGINYTTDSSGILYEIITPGAATKPNLCETLSMTYTGKLLNGTQFDAGTISYPLSQLIVGWQIAVPKIGKGGRIKVLIPSTLAYGAQAVGTIPANSPLFFDIVLN
jgi:FKBP-type peptidyl-prolyl cis-trans isomerase